MEPNWLGSAHMATPICQSPVREARKCTCASSATGRLRSAEPIHVGGFAHAGWLTRDARPEPFERLAAEQSQAAEISSNPSRWQSPGGALNRRLWSMPERYRRQSRRRSMPGCLGLGPAKAQVRIDAALRPLRAVNLTSHHAAFCPVHL